MICSFDVYLGLLFFIVLSIKFLAYLSQKIMESCRSKDQNPLLSKRICSAIDVLCLMQMLWSLQKVSLVEALTTQLTISSLVAFS